MVQYTSIRFIMTIVTLWQVLMRLDCDKKISATGKYNANASRSEAEKNQAQLIHVSLTS